MGEGWTGRIEQGGGIDGDAMVSVGEGVAELALRDRRAGAAEDEKRGGRREGSCCERRTAEAAGSPRRDEGSGKAGAADGEEGVLLGAGPEEIADDGLGVGIDGVEEGGGMAGGEERVEGVGSGAGVQGGDVDEADRRGGLRSRSEEHTSELQ